MTTTTSTTRTIDASVVSRSSEMILGWNGDVFSSLSMSEGLTLSSLFEGLGQSDVAEHIARGVWESEPSTDVDPLPWANGHGGRKTDHEVSYEDRFESTGLDRFRFAPRFDFEGRADVAAHWAKLNGQGVA